MTNENCGTKIEFAETMRGYVDAAQTSYADGYAAGKAKGNALSINVSVLIPDLQRFLDEPEHAGTLDGEVDCSLLGGSCAVQSGVFRLLPDTADRGQVFGYHGLYVADGSALPGAVGANPAATISAVSVWITEGITGIVPDDDLGMHAVRRE